MGNLESADGGPGEPPSVSLLPPPGKMPMPEPCELEERFALVLVRAEPSPFPLHPPPRSPRPGWDWAAVPPLAHPFGQGFRQTPSSTQCLSGTLRAAAGRSAGPTAPSVSQSAPSGTTGVSTPGPLGGAVPRPGTPDFSPRLPFCCPSHFSPLPRHPPQAPGFSFPSLWRVRGNSVPKLGPGPSAA